MQSCRAKPYLTARFREYLIFDVKGSVEEVLC
jgi:hypothetical protein